MKNKSIIFLSLFVIVSMAFVYFYKSPHKKSSLSIQKLPKKEIKKSKKPKFFKTIIAYSSEKNPKKQNEIQDFSKKDPKIKISACKMSLENHFVNLDFQNEESRECLQFIHKNYPKSSFSQLLKYCESSSFKAEECEMIPVFTKVMITALDPAYDSIDLKELDDFVIASRIVWNIIGFDNPIPLKNLNEIIAYSDEFIERDPDIYDAYKAKALAFFLKENLYKDKDVDKKMEDVFDEIDLFDHNDSQIDELIMVRYLMSDNLNAAEDMALVLLDENSQNYVGAYFMAAVEWRDGNKDKAYDWLNEALEMSPQNPRVLNSLKKIEEAELGESIFTFNLDVKFEGVNN